MAEKFVSERNINFLLYEVFDALSLTKYPRFEDQSRETFDMVVSTSMKLGTSMMHPVFKEMDKKAPEYSNGNVKVHPIVKKYMAECGQGGWIAAGFPYEKGGQQIPHTVLAANRLIVSAANYSLSVFPLLTMGAAGLIVSFGSKELADTYLPKMFSGEWQGTMALTEPGAGSSLTDLTTQAEPTGQGYHKITGQKIFISAGNHDAVDNVVHLMLARIKGAPAGVKGISLFVVPKYRVEKDGSLVFNDVVCPGIDHKLGYRGAPIAQLSMGEEGNCRGFLVGQEHQGLRCMFQMMNEARIDVGLGAAAIASAAYYESLEYCKQRPQGRNIKEKDPLKPQIPIVEHPDVRRMLLFQKAVVEGSLSLVFYLAKCSDMTHVTSGAEKEKYSMLLELLTPIVKTYASEMGILSVSQGLQCLGGYGYCDDFTLQQHYRDIRIHPIHEGTTGIQGMDLLGRKVMMNDGKAVSTYLGEIQKTIQEARAYPDLKAGIGDLEEALTLLHDVTNTLKGIASQGKVDLFLADATLYLEFFSIICIAWQWLIQAVVACKALSKEVSGGDSDFYHGKLCAYRYFFGYELPKIAGLAKRLKNGDGLTVDMKTTYFED
jgi:butyryl-CoA dehydrogenase